MCHRQKLLKALKSMCPKNKDKMITCYYQCETHFHDSDKLVASAYHLFLTVDSKCWLKYYEIEDII